MKRLYNTKYHICALCITSFVTIYLFIISTNVIHNADQIAEKYTSNFVTAKKAPEKQQTKNVVRIASVMCPQPGDKISREEMTVLMKSVITSAFSNKIESEIEFHLVLSSQEDKQYFKSKLKEFSQWISPPKIKFYSTDDAVSKFYPFEMKTEQIYPCQYLRIFLPKILPDIDAVIYLNTDVMITGNIQDLWNKFYEMSRDQVVAMGPEVTENNPRMNTWSGDLPYAPPKGLNVGVQLMNLTRMREVGWAEKHVELHSDYVRKRNVTLKSVQKLTNIVLHFNPTFFLELPCHFNFLWRHCSNGFYCDSAFADPNGIQVIHGAGDGFVTETVFHGVFHSYRDFHFDSDISSLKTYLVDQLMTPINKYYTLIYNDKDKSGLSKHKSCEGALAKHLFKRILDRVNK